MDINTYYAYSYTYAYWCHISSLVTLEQIMNSKTIHHLHTYVYWCHISSLVTLEQIMNSKTIHHLLMSLGRCIVMFAYYHPSLIWNTFIMFCLEECKFPKLNYNHLFTKQFHKNCSSLIRINFSYSCLLPTAWALYHLCDSTNYTCEIQHLHCFQAGLMVRLDTGHWIKTVSVLKISKLINVQ